MNTSITSELHSWKPRPVSKTKWQRLKYRSINGLYNENDYHIKTSWSQVKPRIRRYWKHYFVLFFWKQKWTSKCCFIISVKKCLAQWVPTYLPIQNICHAYTVSVCIPRNNGIGRAMAATRSDAPNVKPLAEYLKVAIWKIFQLVFIWMAWLICWKSKSVKAVKEDVQIASRKATEILTVSNAACCVVKSA